MALVDLEMARGHLRVFQNDDDSQIALYLAAAESIVTEYLDRLVMPIGSTLPVLGEDGYDRNPIIVTAPISAAILLVMADLYENREADPESNLTVDRQAILPRAVRALLAPWRVWRTFEEDCTQYWSYL